MKNVGHKIITVCSKPLLKKSLDGSLNQECFLDDQNSCVANCILFILFIFSTNKVAAEEVP